MNSKARWGRASELLTYLSIAVACICIFFALCIAMRFFIGLKPGDMSGWLQAVGSIVTIIWGMWIASSKARKDADQKRREQRIVITIVLDIAQRACTLVGKYKQQQVSPSVYGVSLGVRSDGLESIDNLSMELKAIDLTTIGSPRVVSAVLRLRGACVEFLEEIRSENEKSIARLAIRRNFLGYKKADIIHAAAMILMDACKDPSADN